MRFCFIALFALLLSGCNVSEVNSRGYIISHSQKEEVPLSEEEVTP